MKILITTPIFPPEIGGPSTYVSELAQRLANHNQVTIVTFTPNPKAYENITIVSIPQHHHFLGTLFRQVKLAYTIYKLGKRVDLIYTQGPVVVGFISVIVGKLMNKATIIKFVGDIVWEESERKGLIIADLEGFLSSKNKPFFSRLLMVIQSLSLQWSTKIIVPSSYLKNILINYYSIKENKIEVIHNSVEIPESKITKERKEKKIIIVTAGRLVSHKRFDLLIKAFKDVIDHSTSNDKRKLKLLIIGDGPERRNLEELVDENDLKYSVVFTGAINKKRLYQELRKSKIFVLVSEYEGLPHAIIEAMLLEVPIIASDIPGNREVIKQNETGILVNLNIIDLSLAITSLLTNRKLSKQLVENAKKYAQEKFNWQKHIKHLIHIFRQELNS